MQIFRNEIMFEPSRPVDRGILTAIRYGFHLQALNTKVERPPEVEDLTERVELGSGPAPRSYMPISITRAEAGITIEALGATLSDTRRNCVVDPDLIPELGTTVEELKALVP
jgi:hypothetical protein